VGEILAAGNHTVVYLGKLRPISELRNPEWLFLNRDTSCNTHIRVVTLNACRRAGSEKENQNERHTLWSHWELRPTYFEGTHQARHHVTAVARDTSKIPSTVKAVKDDLSSVETITSIIAGADVVVSAYAPPQDNTDALLGVTERQIAAVTKAGTARLIVVGGAGLLEVAPGVTLIASGYLPEAYLPIAKSHEKGSRHPQSV